MPKVFIVEDRPDVTRALERYFKAFGVETVFASTLAQARERFAVTEGIDVIVMDGSIETRGLDTIPLVEEFRKTFVGPMVAASGTPEFQDALVAAGCSHHVEFKGDVGNRVLELLGIR